MENKFIIRPLLESDSQHWLKMWHAYLEFYQTQLAQEITNNTLEKLLSDDKTINCFVACNEQGDLIAFMNYVLHFSTWRLTPVCYLHDLYVKDDYRKEGVAKLLMEKLKEMGKTDKWGRIYWFTKPDNKIARSFYDKIAQVPDWVRYDLIF